MAQPNTTQALASLLHRADQLSTIFHTHHASSFNSVQSISSSYSQLVNLSQLPDRPATRSNPMGGMKERGMVKVQEAIEEGLAGVRDDLGRMERDVEQLGQLLYEADLFLQEGGVLGFSLNPREALTHVSGMFSSYQAELIRLREVLADFTCEEISIDDFVEQWRVMQEVDQAKEQELDDLVDVLGSWGAQGLHDPPADVDMS